MQREGTKVKWVKCDDVQFLEIKRLLPPGFSLAKFGALVGIAETKALFCFDWLTDPAVLQRPTLPTQAQEWVSRLTGTGPSQAEVDVATAFFAERAFPNLGAYLEHYLALDCVILAKATRALMRGYYDLLGMHPVDQRKFTISSFAFAGSQMELFRHRRVGAFFCNNPRVHSLLKNACRGGLTMAMRSFGGKMAEAAPFVDLYKRQRAWSGSGGGGPGHLTDEAIEKYLRACNAHLFGGGAAATTTA